MAYGKFLHSGFWSVTNPFKKRLDDNFERNVGWRDNLADILRAKPGKGTPTQANFGPSGNIQQIKFGVGDSVYVVWHINHDVAIGEDGFFHVHWSSSGTDVNPVHWDLTWTVAIGHGQGVFPTDASDTVIGTPDGTAWTHYITEQTTGVPMPEPDTLVLAELTRVTNGATDNADDVFGLMLDIHYPVDRYATPSRVPDFYT